MNRLRDPQWVLILMFLGIIASVPLIQIVIEAREQNGIRAFEVFSQVPTAANFRAYERDLEAANWAARLSRPLLQFAQFTWLKEGGEKAVIGRDGWYFYKPGLNYMLARPERARASMATNDPVAAIVDFRDQLAAQGIHLLVMPVPNKESVYPDRVTWRAKPGHGVLATGTRELLERLQASKVEVIDLFKEFENARKQSGSSPPVPFYLAQDTHWSPLGVDLAAKVAAQRLVELGWARLGEVHYTERLVLVRRLGDILRMLQIPPVERQVAPETVSCAQVVRPDNGQPYKDAAGAEILVLGDSFMRVYQQDEPESAGFIAHLAKELKQPMMALVNDGGGSTLVRQELRARPVFLKGKKTVLWEFVERDIGLGVEGWKKVAVPTVVSPSSTGVHTSAGDKPSRAHETRAARLTELRPGPRKAILGFEPFSLWDSLYLPFSQFNFRDPIHLAKISCTDANSPLPRFGCGASGPSSLWAHQVGYSAVGYFADAEATVPYCNGGGSNIPVK